MLCTTGLLSHLIPASHQVALAHRASVIGLERALHVFIEPSVQAWALNAHWLMDIAVWSYLNAHYVVTIGALLFIYMRRNDSFYFVRNTFMIAMLVALISYALYPTAPPQLMPGWGFTDTIQQLTGVTVEKGPSSALLNLYGAIPSMHVCFALITGIPMSKLVRRRLDRLGGLSHVHRLRGHRHREQLPDRRVPGCDHRRRLGQSRRHALGAPVWGASRRGRRAGPATVSAVARCARLPRATSRGSVGEATFLTSPEIASCDDSLLCPGTVLCLPDALVVFRSG